MFPEIKTRTAIILIRKGELVVLTSGTGIGKSSVCRELICHLIRAGKKVGMLMLEESVKRSGRNLMGIHLNCPPYWWAERGISEQQKKEAFDATVAKVVMFDHFGSVDPENLLARVRYMTKALGCEYVFLDHLSIVVSGLGDGDERRLIDNAMTSLRSLVEETQIALFVVIFAIGISEWPKFARTVRGSTMVERNKEYVQAARVIGVSPPRIMLSHVLPNVLGPVLVIATLNLGLAILSEATLSFLGVGVPATQPSLGTLIRIGNDFLFSGEWWITIFPGVTLIAMVLSVNLLGDWLRDALNPKLR